MTTVSNKTYGNSDNPVVVSGDTYTNITLNTDHGKDYSGSPKFTVRGGTVNGLTANNGSYVNIYGGSVSNISINNGGFVQDFSSTSVSGVTVSNGGELSLQEQSTAQNVTISPGGLLTLHSGVSITGLTINNDSLITFADLTQTIKVTVGSNGYLSIADSNGKIIPGYSIQLSSASQKQFAQGTVFKVQQSSNQYDNNRDQVIVCFLSGSLIKTPNGNKSVEKIVLGDDVITYADGVEVTRPITWVGKSTCHVRPYLPENKAGYPVRILKGAIAENVPFKDLLITAEHCLFFEGKFVPARMLVNGRSIFYDHSFTSYDYYHVETEEHSVIMADGMLTESYLDTGNRRSFRQEGDVVSIGHSRQMTWSEDASAPLEVSRAFVEPLFRVLEKRADKVGYGIQSEPRPLTYESDLHLVTGSGAVIRSARRQNGWVVFMIPEGIETIRLVSNASRPCDVIGPFVDDRRYFGVAVGDITLFTAEQAFTIDTHLTDADLDGWNSLEKGNTRWTTGNAHLPISHGTHSGPALLSIQVTQEGPYITTEASPEKHALKA